MIVAGILILFVHHHVNNKRMMNSNAKCTKNLYIFIYIPIYMEIIAVENNTYIHVNM